MVLNMKLCYYRDGRQFSMDGPVIFIVLFLEDARAVHIFRFCLNFFAADYIDFFVDKPLEAFKKVRFGNVRLEI